MLEIRLLDFALGMAAGLLLGLALVFLVSRVRSWLGKSAVGRLTTENRELKRRLAEKLAQGKALEMGQEGS